MNVSFQPQIEAAARRHGLDPLLLEAVAAQETGGPGSNSGRNIVGDGGHGRGIFQIDDRYHAFARTAAAMDPAANAEYAAGMIAGNLKRFGSIRAALSAYNAGDPNAEGTKTTWGDGKTLGYADSVLRHYEELARGDAPEASANANGLLNALLSMENSGSGPAACPSMPSGQSSQWLAQRGLDSTGHARDTTSDFSIIGGDDN